MSSDDTGAKPTPDDPDDLDDIEIETTGVWEENLEKGTDPLRDPSLAAVSCGRPDGEPRIFVRADALEKIIDHTAEDTKNEVAGVLLGRFYTDRDQRVTDVLDVLPAPETRAGLSHVTFSHETWAAIFEKVDPSDGQAIVGWYHSHPGFGVFLSKQDVFIQEFFFDGDGHVALVLDPVKHEVGVFTRQEGRVLPGAGFWISAPKEQVEKAKRYVKMLRYKITGENRGEGGFLRRLLARLFGPK